jgi:hypothetical protein
LIEIKSRGRSGARIGEAMDADSLQPRIEHEIAELRGQFPAVTACHSMLLQSQADGGERWSLHLEFRAPQVQVIVSGPAEDSADAAIAAAGRMARERLAALRLDPYQTRLGRAIAQ